MGDALLFGGGGGASGIRTKNISKAAYDNLPEEKKNDPKVVWIITDADAYDYGASYADNLTKQMNDLVNRVNELSDAMGGVKFSITESGGLRVTYEVEDGE